jgi:hypothetical protein
VSVRVCPIVSVRAPAEKVWSFVSEPTNYALWWDAETRRIVPEGSAQVGQVIYADTRAFGRSWNVNVLVEGIEPANQRIHLKTSLPFGITVFNHITCSAQGSESCQVSFG